MMSDDLRTRLDVMMTMMMMSIWLRAYDNSLRTRVSCFMTYFFLYFLVSRQITWC